MPKRRVPISSVPMRLSSVLKVVGGFRCVDRHAGYDGKNRKTGARLGRRGLMPNPRTGTVVQLTNYLEPFVKLNWVGWVFRVDRTSLIHVPIGKASFELDQLMDNLSALMDNITRSRPSGVKGQYIRTAYLTTTMGPSVKMDVASTSALRVE